MSPHEQTTPIAIIVLKTLSLLLGGLITYFSYRAYQRTGSRPLRALSAGFAVITVGTILAGALDIALQAGFRVGLLVESGLITVGFAIIVYSLYTE